MSQTPYSIRMAARLTGLSEHVLRIWEQRYQAVRPVRTSTQRRLYRPDQIERLKLLRTVTQAGHRVGQVARLEIEELRRLAAEIPGGTMRETPRRAEPGENVSWVESCLDAIRALDARALEALLRRAAMELGAVGFLQRLVAPLLVAMGERWRAGELTAAQEHFATASLRVHLGHAASAFGSLETAPMLMVTTPAGQLHELGALLVAAMAANLGWRVTYLGASLPAAEIAGAARQGRARVVALSLVYPEDDPRLEQELVRLRELLPKEVALLVGGRAMEAFRPVLRRLGAVPVATLAQLGAALDRIRKEPDSRRRAPATRRSRSRSR